MWPKQDECCNVLSWPGLALFTNNMHLWVDWPVCVYLLLQWGKQSQLRGSVGSWCKRGHWRLLDCTIFVSVSETLCWTYMLAHINSLNRSWVCLHWAHDSSRWWQSLWMISIDTSPTLWELRSAWLINVQKLGLLWIFCLSSGYIYLEFDYCAWEVCLLQAKC